MMTTKTLIGYVEWAELPILGIRCKAKIDTGAATSCIHAEQIEVFERDGQEWVRFHVRFHNEVNRIDQLCEAAVIDHRQITSSNGISNHRYIIKTDLTLAGQTSAIEISLSHRGSMKYPMLIGRKALQGVYLVDVEHAFLGTHTQL